MVQLVLAGVTREGKSSDGVILKEKAVLRAHGEARHAGPFARTGRSLDDRFHETTQLHLGLSIHGMRPFRASHMIRTLETLD